MLSDAVLMVAEAMEQEASGMGELESASRGAFMLRSFARELRVAVKANEGAPAAAKPMSQFERDAEASRLAMEQDQKDRMERRVHAQEAGEVSMTTLVGGASDGVMTAMDPSAPPGAKSIVAGEVYQKAKADGKWHFSKEFTDELRRAAEQKAKQEAKKGRK